MNKIIDYINPIVQLGIKKYSVIFPLLASTFIYVISELVINFVFRNPDLVGIYIIFLSAALVIYFSFRDGIRGGYSATIISISYYLYIIFTRQREEQYQASLVTTMTLGLLFFFLSFVIGWLKERIDTLIEAEANERKRLQTIIQQLPVGIIVTDNQGNVVETNKQVEQLVGVKVLIGRNITSSEQTTVVRDPKTSQTVSTSSTPLALAILKGKTTVGEEYAVHHKSGKKTFIQVSASPIHNKKGAIFAAASIITDITQQKQVEQLKDEFISVASHELKTPITAVKGYVQILDRIVSDSKHTDAKKYLQKTNVYIDKLSSLVADLLDVSKINAGKLEFSKSEYDLNTVIKETVDSFQAFTNTHRIIKKGSVKQKLFGDSSRTEQVLINLLNNAIKYSPDGKKVIITIENTKKDVTVKVTDFGVGIPENKKKNIFKRFYRVEETSQQFTGLGIGLYISSEIISRQGGKMWVESEETVGSTFCFSLPFKA